MPGSFYREQKATAISLKQNHRHVGRFSAMPRAMVERRARGDLKSTSEVLLGRTLQKGVGWLALLFSKGIIAKMRSFDVKNVVDLDSVKSVLFAGLHRTANGASNLWPVILVEREVICTIKTWIHSADTFAWCQPSANGR